MIDEDRESLAKCVRLLGEVFGKDASLISNWWEYPHPYLGKKPRVAMIDGDIERVVHILESMKDEDPS